MAQSRWNPAQRIAVGYLVVCVAGALLLSLPFSHRVAVGFTDAMFTSASATFVTGLSTVSTPKTWTPMGAGVIALLIQVGGAGITLATTLVYLVLGRKITIGERKFIAEERNFSTRGVIRLIRSVLFFSLTIEGVSSLAFALYFHFRYSYPWLRAVGVSVFHSISAFNNAGFDLWGTSLEGFQADPFVLLLTSLLIILGGLGFVVITELYSFPRNRVLSLHTKIVLRLTLMLLLSGTLFTLLFEARASMAGLAWPDKLLNAWFTSVTLRTAGFDSIPIGSMRDVTWFIFIIYMFIGASPGSTGGGIKTTTFYMVFKAASSTIRGRQEISSGERTIPLDIAMKSLVIFLLASGVIFVGTLLDAILEPKIPFLKLTFEQVSAFGTVGLTTGITSIIHAPMKWVLIFTMYVGRIGIFTFLVSLTQRRRNGVSHVQERILIG